MTPDTYVLDIKYGDQCFLTLAKNSGDYWLMGDGFLRNYISIWDETNNQLGFVPHSFSNATITAGTLSSNVVEVDPNASSNSDSFIANYNLDFIQIGLIGGAFTGMVSTMMFSMV